MIRISEGPTKIKLIGPDAEIRALADQMRVRPKGFEHAPTYKAWVLTDGKEGWDGYVNALRLLDEGQADCLRGHKDTLIAIAHRKNILLDLSRCLKSPFAALVSDDVPPDIIVANFKLDQYQRESVAYWLSHGMGVNKIAVNGGKTAMFAAAAAMILRRYPEARVLYVTQSERLVRQAYRDIKGFLPGLEVTQFGGSKKDRSGKDIVIATVAMLTRHRLELVNEEWFRGFMAVLYDESHHAAAATSTQLLMSLPCFFRLGASDTRHDNDPAKAAKVQGLLGPIRYVVPVGTYIDLGRSARPTIYLVENSRWHNRHKNLPYQAEPYTPAWALVGSEWKHGTYLGPVYQLDDQGQVVMRRVRELKGAEEQEVYDGEGTPDTVKVAEWEWVEKPVTVDGYHTLQFDDDEAEYTVDSRYCLLRRVYDKAITSFKERNALITAWTRYYAQEKHFPTLVVCTRTMHVLILEALIQDALGQDRVKVLFSDHTSAQRDEVFAWFRGGQGRVLVSPLVKEGVSINEICGGVIADYVGDWEVMNQIIGRFIRKKAGDNQAFITAFIDVQHPSLRRGCRRVYNKLHDVRGYQFYHPCIGPETIPLAKEFKCLA
jgi:superfamily II DNA or RNA helicase